ncbi:KH domain-containing protein [Verrucomicrobiota bacterium sgz303538]
MRSTSYDSCLMQEFLDFVLRQLIDFPDEMILTKHEANRKVVFRLQLKQSDVGKVIGKHGQTIIAIRNLLSAAAARHGQRAVLEIVE